MYLLFLFFTFITKMRNMKVFEYVNNLIQLLQDPNKFNDCDFSILCDKYPVLIGRNSFRARVLYVSLKNKEGEIKRLYPDKLKELDFEYINITSNLRRRISMNLQEFFINGNTELQEYKENSYFNYSIEKANPETKKIIEQLRQKYNIESYDLFVGKHQDLILE